MINRFLRTKKTHLVHLFPCIFTRLSFLFKIHFFKEATYKSLFLVEPLFPHVFFKENYMPIHKIRMHRLNPKHIRNVFN
jgi:hypothetical protein